MDRCLPLLECIALIPDPRHARGVRHPLVAMLALACAATLCGYRSYSAMAEWGRTYGVEIRRALGFTRDQSPCAATFYHLSRRLDRVALEACLGGWVHQVLAVLPAEEEATGPAGVAVDGKTLRGSRKQGAPHHILKHPAQMDLFQQGHRLPRQGGEARGQPGAGFVTVPVGVGGVPPHIRDQEGEHAGGQGGVRTGWKLALQGSRGLARAHVQLPLPDRADLRRRGVMDEITIARGAS